MDSLKLLGHSGSVLGGFFRLGGTNRVVGPIFSFVLEDSVNVSARLSSVFRVHRLVSAH